MGGSHRTLIGLLLPIKHATTDILDFPMDEPLFRSVHSKSYKAAIGKPNFEVVATSGKNVFSRSSFVSGKGPKARCDGAFTQLRLR